MMLCVGCLTNYGLRTEAAKLGHLSKDGQPCTGCGSVAAVLITKEQVDQLLERFFVHGSTAPTGRWESIYSLSGSRPDSTRPPVFDRTLQRDFEVLREHSSGSLILNAPSTWRLGHTLIAEDVSRAIGQQDSVAISKHLDRVIAHCKTTVIDVGTSIFRVRRNVESPFDDGQYDTSPHTSSSRFSDGSVSVMYGAFDIETCIHEARVLAEDEITVGTLQPTRELRVLDLTDIPYDAPSDGAGEGGDIFYFVNARLLLGARSAEAHAFGRRVRERGFEGIVYPSFFSDVRLDRTRFPNVAIFGHPIRDQVLALQSLNNLRVDTIRYEYTFGPVTKAPSTADVEELLAVLDTGISDSKEIVKRINEVMSRSDPPC